MRTIADAHRDNALALVLARQGYERTRARKGDTAPHEKAIADIGQRIKDLSTIEAPPKDTEEFVQARLDLWRSNLEDDVEKWDRYINSPDVAVLIFGDTVDKETALKNKVEAQRALDALDAAEETQG